MEPVEPKPKTQKKQKCEANVEMACDTSFKDWFDEIVPFTGKAAHSYSVELVRAEYSKESFEVFKKYEEHVHKKKDKSKQSYENFLC